MKKEISAMRIQLERLIEELLPPEQRTLLQHEAPNYCHLIIVDETERLSIKGIEQLREIYDQGDMGLIFIGMPGLEKKLSRYPQLYSRIGFAHRYQTFRKEEVRYLLSNYWNRLGLSIKLGEYTDAEAIAAIIRVTNGNFRLLNGLFRQIHRIVKINELSCITAEVVETARECLVIGTL